ncbi:MAG: AEC family transporter [Cyanobacteria bacterium]|nr:AEC family transporter [Cyanobacteriota bacterium]
MVDTLIHAYTPLIVWVTVGILLLRILPGETPYWLGRALYWFGVPWQIFDLSRHSKISGEIGLAPAITVGTLSLGLLIAWVALQSLEFVKHRYESQKATLPLLLPTYEHSQYGPFIIAAMLGNTGFVGLGILPTILEPSAFSWAVFFSLTQNIIGTYFIGVLIASHFGERKGSDSGWILARDILTVPSLWACGLGYLSRGTVFPVNVETFASSSLIFVVPMSFLLMGLRLAQINGWKSLRNAVVPVGLKMVVLPALVGVGTSFLGLTGDVRLGLVLMAGMPSAFASLILAEEYDMNRDLAASSIALSTIVLLFMIPVWLWIF